MNNNPAPSKRPLIMSLQNGVVTFGKKPLFENLSFNIHKGDKICLIGKNGAGKTTLMQLISGTQELDSGKRFQQPGIVVGYLPQIVNPDPKLTVADYIFQGLSSEKQNEHYRYIIDMVMEPLELHPTDFLTALSGGQLRRAALARALVEEPDILLLDEPTNHLDLVGIEWLENYLNNFKGTLLCVSHDKAFLANISDKVFWLEQGIVRVCPQGYAYFDEWSEMILEQQARELENRSKIIANELEWASQGVKARRKRNVRRLEEVKIAREKLRSDLSHFRKATQTITMEATAPAEISSRIVAEFYKVKKSFKAEDREKNILDSFSLRIMRGDRIGLLGRNGSGKSTFLKLLVGEITPDAGKVKVAHNLDISYLDQKRQDLNPQNSLKNTLCPTGGDYVEVAGKMRHVTGYLRDFMFDPSAADDLIGTLSGGQKNRLMLAKILAKPGSLLILDEPTNDLDMDTLDMLEEILSTYTGTLIVVSHDRDFLDHTVTSVIAFEGDAKIEMVVGGYSDYLAEKEKKSGKKQKPFVKEKVIKEEPVKNNSSSNRKLSNKESYQLGALPEKIKNLEEELLELNKLMEDPNLYIKNPELFDKASRRIAKAQQELGAAETLWLELEEKLQSSG